MLTCERVIRTQLGEDRDHHAAELVAPLGIGGQSVLEQLQGILAGEQDPEFKDRVRRVMVAIFTELGADHPLAREHRRRLAAALN